METRPLGSTGIDVSVLGYGAWGIGQHMWVGADDDRSLAALRRATDGGVNFIDTALAYGDGHSEQLVGRAVRESEQTVHVATKIPPKDGRWPAQPGSDPDDAFPADWIRTCTERSLGHLGLATIDVQQFHVWSDEWVGRGSWLDAVKQLKSEGTIRSFGVSINDHEPENALRLIESGVVDTVQVICFSHPAVSTVIAGMRRLENVDANIAAAEAGPLDDTTLETLRKHRWQRNFYR